MTKDVSSNLTVEVIYALPRRQFVTRVNLNADATYGDAIKASSLLKVFPELVYEELKVGSYGKIKKLTDKLTPFDRVEVYREITADPRTAVKRR